MELADSPLSNCSPYALTKRCDEEWAKQYTRHYGLDTYGMRYFNVFGRRQDPHGAYAAVIPKFIKQLLNEWRVSILHSLVWSVIARCRP